jgi:hypothetical protein
MCEMHITRVGLYHWASEEYREASQNGCFYHTFEADRSETNSQHLHSDSTLGPSRQWFSLQRHSGLDKPNVSSFYPNPGHRRGRK